MKKKLLITLFAIIATLTCALGLAACDIFGGGKNDETESGNHKHTWSQTYTVDGDRHYQTCSGCNEKKYGDHNYIGGVCICGKKKPIIGTNGLKYSLNEDNDSYSVTGIGTASDTDIVIPSYHNGEPVTAIGRDAFRDCSSLKSITIPDSVTFINYMSFYGCTSLTNINIPNSVTSISNMAFRDCSSLKSITIPDSVTSIGSDAFNGCTKLIQTENGVQYVDKWVIGCDKSVTQVSLRNDTKGIAGYAFSGCSFTSITIPDGVTSIGGNAFSGCSSLTSITISDSVTFIGSFAFYGCSKLTSITIPDSVTSIGGDSAFRGCSSLTSITIPDSVTSIGFRAFDDCSKLTSITFKGTIDEWEAIKKGSTWDFNTGNYTVHCTDGTVAKDGTVTKN